MITVYTTPTCPRCKQVKEWLKEKQVEFNEIDVSENQEAAQMMIQLTDQMGVPVTVVGEQFFVGFDEAKLSELLEN